MEHTRFVGLDIHKERISIAVAERAFWGGAIPWRDRQVLTQSASYATVSGFPESR
jgi:hypothetical protein